MECSLRLVTPGEYDICSAARLEDASCTNRDG
jgi:hypothetical protein